MDDNAAHMLALVILSIPVFAWGFLLGALIF